jgi:hypothetical protein
MTADQNEVEGFEVKLSAYRACVVLVKELTLLTRCVLFVVNQSFVYITASLVVSLVTPREEKLWNYAGEKREGWEELGY